MAHTTNGMSHNRNISTKVVKLPDPPKGKGEIKKKGWRNQIVERIEDSLESNKEKEDGL